MNGNDPQSDDVASAVNRIAQALDIPVTTFLTATPALRPSIETPVEDMGDFTQMVSLLQLFVRLRSPEARSRCNAYVVKESTRDG